jgi:hypothetical protein
MSIQNSLKNWRNTTIVLVFLALLMLICEALVIRVDGQSKRQPTRRPTPCPPGAICTAPPPQTPKPAPTRTTPTPAPVVVRPCKEYDERSNCWIRDNRPEFLQTAFDKVEVDEIVWPEKHTGALSQDNTAQNPGDRLFTIYREYILRTIGPEEFVIHLSSGGQETLEAQLRSSSDERPITLMTSKTTPGESSYRGSIPKAGVYYLRILYPNVPARRSVISRASYNLKIVKTLSTEGFRARVKEIEVEYDSIRNCNALTKLDPLIRQYPNLPEGHRTRLKIARGCGSYDFVRHAMESILNLGGNVIFEVIQSQDCRQSGELSRLDFNQLNSREYQRRYKTSPFIIYSDRVEIPTCNGVGERQKRGLKIKADRLGTAAVVEISFVGSKERYYFLPRIANISGDKNTNDKNAMEEANLMVLLINNYVKIKPLVNN